MTFRALLASNLNQGLWIMLRGLVVVFLVMGLIAAAMWLSGKYFVSREAKEKVRLKAEDEQKKAAAEQEKAVARTADGDGKGGA